MKLAIKCYIFGNTVKISTVFLASILNTKIKKKMHFLADTSVYNHRNLLNPDK